jgi:hypothetical protein
MRTLDTIVRLWGSDIAEHYNWERESLHLLDDLTSIARRTKWTSAESPLNKAILRKEPLRRHKDQCPPRVYQAGHLE